MRNEHEPRLESGMIGCGFWARYCGQYAGGYRTQIGAINAAKRKYQKMMAKFHPKPTNEIQP